MEMIMIPAFSIGIAVAILTQNTFLATTAIGISMLIGALVQMTK